VQLDAHLPDGSVRSLLFHAALLPAMHGHPASVVMPFLDVTQLKRVEGQLQSAVAARDEFLSIASHELRTPLTALQLELQGLQKRLGRGETMTSEQLSHRLETAIRQVNRLGKLVNSLLDISRLTAGRIDLQIAEVDLAEVAREVTARLAKEATQAGCSLGCTAGEEPATGQWDRLRLEQIVSNLVSNAIKYGGGRPIEVAVEHDGTRARLRVSDRGIGIAPEDQARIFDRFERAVSERHYGGFGLGLWIVRQIVHALQGGIWVQSRVGEGATFIVELPRERRPPTPPPPMVEAR
jgi:signal transduction histidine kinase